MILLVFSFLFYSIISVAQTGPFLEINKGNYDAAYRQLVKEAVHRENEAYTYFGLAKIFSKENFSKYNLDSAYMLAQHGSESFKKLNDKKKDNLYKDRISGTSFQILMDSIAIAGLSNAARSKDFDKIKRALAIYPSNKYIKWRKLAVAAQYNLISLQISKKNNNFDDLASIYDQYAAPLKKDAPSLYALLENQLAVSFIKKYGFEKLDSFLSVYPNSFFASDTTKNYFLRIRQKGNVMLFQQFSKNYPKSFYRQLAEDSVAVYLLSDLIKGKNVLQELDFIEKHPDLPGIEALDESLSLLVLENPYSGVYSKTFAGDIQRKFPKTVGSIYTLYAYRLRLEDLNDFERSYPTYAISETFQNDQKLATIAEELLFDPLHTPPKKEAVIHFIEQAAPRYPAFIAVQKLLKPYIEQKKYTEALTLAKTYLPLFKDKAYYRDILTLLSSSVNANVTISPLQGDSINLKDFREFSPVVAADEKTLFFTRSAFNGSQEDIYTSKKIKIGWSKPQPVKEINTSTNNESIKAVTADGSRLFIFSNGLLKTSEKTVAGWSPPKPLSSNVNSANWQSDVSISANNQVLLFAARRMDNMGTPGSENEDNTDIYVSFKDKNGEWSYAENIGMDINTPYEDRAPFIHPDMRTLYFSSAGRGGLGQLDVYKTTRLDDSWKHWSKPVNIGKEINTPFPDWGYKVSANGASAYFSANWDLFQVNNLPAEIRPAPVNSSAGIVRSSEGKPIGGVEIQLINLKSGKAIGTTTSDPRTGEYFVVLPADSVYGFLIKKPGYASISQQIRPINESELITDTIQLYTIDEIKKGSVRAPFNNLFFDTDSYQLKSESYYELDRWANFIKENNLKVDIEGYTDNAGSPEHNKTLSFQRAGAAQTYLINKGVPKENISVAAFGDQKPVSSNDTEAGKARNRRIEIRFKG